MKKHRIIALHILFLALFVVPVLAFGANAPGGIVPCDGPGGGKACDFDALILLVGNGIKWVILISFPITAALFAYAGFLFVSDRGSEKNLEKAKEIMWDTVIGFAIILGGYLIVQFILSSLLSTDFRSGFLQDIFKF